MYADDYSDELDCIDKDGYVPVPDGPGLGVAYDWKLIKRNTLETRVIK
jgi:L-alanine-DL-glutamate epimerase-like enolase superfamily enzyme